MFGSIRNGLLAALIAAVGTLGVSYAATGTLNPAKVLTQQAASQAPVLEDGSSGATPTADGSSDVTPTTRGRPGAQGSEGGAERSEVGCGDFTPEEGKKFNHGQFVQQSPKGGEARRAAARSECGKPVHADQTDEVETEVENEVDEDKGSKPRKESGPKHNNGRSQQQSRGRSGK